MNQRYDAIAFSLMLTATVVIVAVVSSPKAFTIQDWQPLMAAFIALGAATVAYRGAMAKVIADREAEMRKERRKARADLLRLHAALVQSEYETRWQLRFFHDPRVERLTVRLISIARSRTSIDETWKDLESFSKDIANGLAEIRFRYLDFEETQERWMTAEVPVGKVDGGAPEHPFVAHAKLSFAEIQKNSEQLILLVKREIDAL